MNKVERFFIGGRNFRQEFRKQMRMLLVVTIGFTIAFTWRQTIFDASQSLMQKFFSSSGVYSSILTSTFITFSGLILLYLTSQLLKEHKDNY